MSIIIDTNILYYAFSGKSNYNDIDFKNVASISALEFLKNIEKIHNKKAKYHIPIRHINAMPQILNLAKDHGKRPFRSDVTDAIIFDFKQDFKSYTLYNNEAVTIVINNNLYDCFYASIYFMDKLEFKDVKERYNFLLSKNINCLPIEDNDIELGYFLLDQFLQRYSIKSDFRNCWNDILILSKAINTGSVLITEDKLLNRFASEIVDCSILVKSREDNVISMEFPKIDSGSIERVARKESKNYINRGWDYKLRKK